MTWKFDSTIADIFVPHARAHIPNFDQVLEKSVQICQYKLPPEARIVDVGCATGKTLDLLDSAGFNNLVGIDNSQDMLDRCNNKFTLVNSSEFNEINCDAVLCNWTLHFIKNKLDYLQKICNNLNQSGFLILSDKTSLDPLPIHFYHQYKSQRGVDQQEIKNKELAVKDIMFIDSPEWYLDALRHVGFNKIHIFDANWCFTSFLACK
jgi:trans-aconitate methyltransferase